MERAAENTGQSPRITARQAALLADIHRLIGRLERKVRRSRPSRGRRRILVMVSTALALLGVAAIASSAIRSQHLPR